MFCIYMVFVDHSNNTTNVVCFDRRGDHIYTGTAKGFLNIIEVRTRKVIENDTRGFSNVDNNSWFGYFCFSLSYMTGLIVRLFTACGSPAHKSSRSILAARASKWLRTHSSPYVIRPIPSKKAVFFSCSNSYTDVIFECLTKYKFPSHDNHPFLSLTHRDFVVNANDRIIRVLHLREEDGLPEVQHKFQDLVNRVQWSQTCFSADGDFVIGGIEMTFFSLHFSLVLSTYTY